MKKTSLILLLAMVLAASVGKAQDTLVPWNTPRYITNDIPPNAKNVLAHPCGNILSGEGLATFTPKKSILGYGYYAPGTWVYGIAAGLNQYNSRCIAHETIDTINLKCGLHGARVDDLQIWAILIHKEEDSLYHRIDSVRWHYRSYPDRIWNCPGDDSTEIRVRNAYEFYFDRPILVTDTFFVCLAVGGDSIGCDSVGDLWLLLDAERGYIYNYGHTEARYIWVSFATYLPEPTIFYEQGFSQLYTLPIVVPPDTDAIGCPPPRLLFMRTISGYPWFKGTLSTDEEAVGYEIRYAPVGSDTWESAYSTSNPFRIHAELDSTITYRGCFRSKHRHGCAIHDTTYWSPWSDTVIFHAGSTASISPVEADGGLFTLAPNPATGMVTVSWELGEQLSLTLTDASGREVLRMPMPAGQTTATLDVSHLPKGIYLVTLKTSQGSSSRQLVVQ